MKLYMVIAESCLDGYESNLTCLGVFDSREKAEKALFSYPEVIKDFSEKAKIVLEENKDDYSEFKIEENWATIKEIELNTEYPLRAEEQNILRRYLTGGIALGGYSE